MKRSIFFIVLLISILYNILITYQTFMIKYQNERCKNEEVCSDCKIKSKTDEYNYKIKIDKLNRIIANKDKFDKDYIKTTKNEFKRLNDELKELIEDNNQLNQENDVYKLQVEYYKIIKKKYILSLKNLYNMKYKENKLKSLTNILRREIEKRSLQDEIYWSLSRKYTELKTLIRKFERNHGISILKQIHLGEYDRSENNLLYLENKKEPKNFFKNASRFLKINKLFDIERYLSLLKNDNNEDISLKLLKECDEQRKTWPNICKIIIAYVRIL